MKFILGLVLSGCAALLCFLSFFVIVELLQRASIGILDSGYLALLLLSTIPFLVCNFLLLFLLRRKGTALKSGIITGCLFIVIPAFGMSGWMESKQSLESRLRWANPRSLQEVSNRVLNARSNKDPEACKGLKGPDYESAESFRTGCLMNVAINTNDLSLCETLQISNSTEQDRLNTTSYKDQCFYAIAMQRNDASLCERAPSEEWRSRCTAGIAWRIQEGIGSSVPDRDTTESLSSATGFSASAFSSAQSFSSSIASIITEASSSIAPFDGCKGIAAYTVQPWFSALQQQAQDFGLTKQEIPEACLSSDYLIFIRTMTDTSSRLYRFSLPEQKLEEAIPEGAYAGQIGRVGYGKRSGSQIPLLQDNCVTDIYDISSNSYKQSGYLCRNGHIACTDTPTTLASGRSVYPKLAEFAHLEFLGQLFTAARCGPDRLKQAFGGEQANYSLGSTVILYLEPAGHIREVLTSIGFECAQEGCREWRLSKTVKVADLLRLLPYAAVMTSDDCVNCG
ncbi:MAG: hypothetical protein PHO92_03740 [Candidatus Peribacteraceae bacterium]|nr:hypothetical protein [Candidatus Peribacteraceae bacterium]